METITEQAEAEAEAPFTVFDCFEMKNGSKQWPSSDPEDSPFDTFTCKYCGASQVIRAYGSYGCGESSLEDRQQKILTHHIKDICLKFPKRCE